MKQYLADMLVVGSITLAWTAALLAALYKLIRRWKKRQKSQIDHIAELEKQLKEKL